nr:MAG: putative capsid protein [Arizlama virus]
MYYQRRRQAPAPKQRAYTSYVQQRQQPLYAATSTMYQPRPTSYAAAKRVVAKRAAAPVKRKVVMRAAKPMKKEPAQRKSSGLFSKLGGIAGSALGTFISPGAGTAIGGALGSGLGDLLSSITGLGAYHINENSLLSEGNQPPKVSNSPDAKSFIIKHREYLCDIVSSGTANTFSVQKFNVNPGDSSTFPYLSNIACNFQEWVPRGIIFEFESTSSEAIASGTNTALGSITMASNYESEQNDFSSLAVMLNSEYTCSGKPSQNIMHPIECAPSQNVFQNGYFVSNGLDNIDTRELQPCEFYIATSGFQGTNVNVGRLWVTYEIHLRKPIGTGLLGSCVKAENVESADYSNASPLGVTFVSDFNNTPITVTGTTINFNNLSAGAFMINVQWFGSTPTSAVGYPSLSFNSSVVTKNVSGAAVLVAPAAGATSQTNASMQFYVKLVDRNAVITFSTSGTLPLGSRYSRVDIIQIPNAYYENLG